MKEKAKCSGCGMNTDLGVNSMGYEIHPHAPNSENCLRNQISQLKKQLEESEWIPISEGLPDKQEKNQDCSILVVVGNDKYWMEGFYDFEDKCWRDKQWRELNNPTHWRKITLPYKTK